MKRMVAGILRQYGTPLTLFTAGGRVDIRGFFHPVRTKSWQNLVNLSTPMGEVMRRQYVFIGPGELTATEGDELIADGRHYILRRLERYHYGEEVIYTWGLCVEKGVIQKWESLS